MPTPTFRALTREQFAQILEQFPFSRRIDAVHMHHTWSPDHSDYQGLPTIVGMWRFHTQTKGWSDIAQHVSIAPDGTIWTGRNWNRAPASSTGFNGSSAVGPFMFETIGNFDAGHDRLEGAQLDSVLAVIALVQKKFGLPPESLRFHRQMTDQKSCPGTGVKRDDIIEKVKAYVPIMAAAPRAIAEDQPFSANMRSDSRFAADVVNELLERGRGRAVGEEAAELDEDTAPRGTPASRDAVDSRTIARGVRALFSAEELARLTPHIVNLNQGELSAGGDFRTTPGDVEAIFTEHIPQFAQAAGVGRNANEPPLRILFFAHGGLVAESGGIAVARKHIDWWKANQVYPIYFIWETGLLETLQQMLARAAGKAGLPMATRDIGEAIADNVTDPLLARIAHTIGGVQIWGSMKFAAQRASEPHRGARLVADTLGKFLNAPGQGIDPHRVELHAAGHSAGSIFHSFFVPVAADAASRPFRTVQFLAPAVRVDTFKETLWPRIAPSQAPAADSLTIYTMKDALERDDNCGPYRKSLLYLIHDGLEPKTGEEILGLERSLRGDAELTRDLVNPATRSKGEVIWSITEGQTTSRKHGDFDDDAPTMNSVGRRVLALRADQQLAQDFATATARNEPWFDAVHRFEFSTMPMPGDYGNLPPWGTAPSPFTGPQDADVTPSAPASQPTSGGGVRRALCIGINDYPTAPLSGCVADAELWQRTLGSLGFSTKLLVNNQATRAGILTSVQEMIAGSKTGDVLVLQYSGHGTEVPDDNGDEEDSKDQALCPFDFADGALLVDDDVATLFRSVPAGVNLTCFFDCCHSGTITRFAVGDSTTSTGGNRKVRFIKASADLIARHREFRRSRGLVNTSGPRAFSMSRGPAGMREVVFSACRRDEVAMESDGQGEFTRRAVPLLGSRTTNKDFQKAVVSAFGARPAQHPILDCAPEVEGNPLFGALGALGASAGGGGRSAWSNGHGRNGGGNGHHAALVAAVVESEKAEQAARLVGEMAPGDAARALRTMADLITGG